MLMVSQDCPNVCGYHGPINDAYGTSCAELHPPMRLVDEDGNPIEEKEKESHHEEQPTG